jgi:hypothetical protein
MTIKDLLIPRYAVAMNYPGSPFKIGDILTNVLGVTYRINGSQIVENVIAIQEFPEIFKPLIWWEFRDREDMPIYLKLEENYMSANGKKIILKAGTVLKVGSYFGTGKEATKYGRGTGAFLPMGKSNTADIENLNAFLPATEEEYLKYANAHI